MTISQPSISRTWGSAGPSCFGTFALIYQRDFMPNLAATSRWRTKSVLKNHLNPEFDDLMLRELTVERLRRPISLALQQSDLAAESVDKIRDVLAAVLRAAVEYGRLSTNPVLKIRLRKRKRPKAKPFIGVEQFYALLEQIPEPYATMVYVAVFAGQRVSELIGLRWRNVHADSVTIEERYCRGDWDEPKSEASRATIPVDEHVIERIHRLKSIEVVARAGRGSRRYKEVKSCGPDELVFQSVLVAGRCETITSSLGISSRLQKR